MKFLAIISLLTLFISCKDGEELEVYSEEVQGKKFILNKLREIKIEEDSLSFIGRILEAKFLDNNLIIADMIQPKLFFFNENGKLIKQFNWSKGEGPGEIKQIGSFDLVNGKIYISDIGNFRWTVFDSTGVFINGIRPFADPRNDSNQNIYENGSIILHFGDEIFTSVIEDKYNRDLYQYRSKCIASLSSELEIKHVFGKMDGIYRKYKIYIPIAEMTIDDAGYIYYSQVPSYLIYKYDRQGNLIKVFGLKKNFKELSEDLPRTLSMNEIIRISKKYSFTDALFYSSKGYILYQYIETTNTFFESKSLLDRNNYLKVYDLDGRYIKPDMKLPGVILTTDSKGNLFILETDEPGNRHIGVYEINVVDD